MIDTHRRAGTWQGDVDRFVAMSGFARDRFVRAGFPADRIAVKPNSVDDPGEPRERERSGIVYAGRLSEEKGVRVLIEAARRTQARIVAIGEGPLAGELAAAAPPNVLFRGPLPRAAVRERIAAAEALVVPSVCYEGSPMVIAEAFAAATPVVASRIGALEGLVEDGRTGLHAQPGDAADLAEKLDRIVADKAGARLMGRRARAHYEAEWSPRANVAALMRVYAEALTEFRARGSEAIVARPRALGLEPVEGDHGA
jgi:glycosyltransferase involved in cell wall biosynthesis